MRFNNIQLLRLVAATGVVLYHLGCHAPVLVNVDPYVFRYPWLAGLPVPLFFAVSGFVLTHAIQKASPGRFLLARFLRLYPGYWLAILLVVGLMRLRLFTEYHRWLIYFVNAIEISLWPAGKSPTPYVLGIEWSLIYEVFLSASLAAFSIAGPRRGLPLLVGLWLVVLMLKMTFLPGFAFDVIPHWSTIALSALNAPFLCGVLVYQVSDRGRAWRWPILGLVIGMVALLPLQPFTPEWHWFHMGVSSAGMVWLAVQFGQLSDRNPLVRLGDCTYGLYLVHVPIMMVVFHATAKAGWIGRAEVLWIAGLAAIGGGLLFGRVECAVHGRLRPLAKLRLANVAVRWNWIWKRIVRHE